MKKNSITIRKSFFLSIIFCVFLSIFIHGCEMPGSNKISPTQAEAFEIVDLCLSYNDPTVRVNAIEVVALTKQLSFMPKVHNLLQDEFVPVRFAAALAVGDLQYIQAQKMITQLLNDNDINVVIAASYAMVRFGYNEYIEILRQTASDSDPIIRANATMLLGKLSDRYSLNLLHQMLQDPDDKVGYQAAEAIAMMGDESIYEKLWSMLISAYADVRVIGIRAMGTLGTKRAEDALITMLDDTVPEVRLAAAEQLGKLNNKSGESQVLEIIRKNITFNMDFQGRQQINILTALAIGQIKSPALMQYLPGLMKNESIYVRLAAAKAAFQCRIR
jgi:HEAT repeat protein